MKRLITLALSFFIFSTQANAENTIKLSPQENITSTTLVTTGIPFAKGVLHSTDSFALFNEQGKEVPIYIKPTLSWHFSSESPESIRAVKIQFFVDNINESNNDYTFKYNALTTLPRLEKQPISNGFMINKNPDKANVNHPIVLAILTPNYLASSDIIPSFYPMREDNQKIYWDAQFEWARKLTYGYSEEKGKYLLANWLFDRPTSLYKGCMRTANPECYIEAFSSYQFWMSSLKRDGTMEEGKGGSLIDDALNPGKHKDSKYVYIEPIKIHLALTGDDTLHDNNFVLDMANLSRNNHYYQAKVDIPYVKQYQSFTERAAGLALLAQVSAYEITGKQVLLDDINKRIDVLYEHQLNNPDGHPSDGTWRHSLAKHEGGAYPGDNVDYDRRFSPWMTENIIDALWQAYQVTNDQRIPEMIRYAGEGLLKWGFMKGSGYQEKYNKTPFSVMDNSYTLGCNISKISPMYFGSSVSPIGDKVSGVTPDGRTYYTGSENTLLYKYEWYTDSHLPELILNLSLALHFETNQEKADALLTIIQGIEGGYLNKNCGDIKSTKRLFNWNNRSNAWGTYLWVMNEKGILPDLSPKPIPEKETDFTTEYNSYFTQSFSNAISSQWSPRDKWVVNNGNLIPQSPGKIIFTPDFKTNRDYTISTTFTTEQEALKTGIIFNGLNDSYYSVKFKSGIYGGIYLRQHTESWDLNGSVIASIPAEITLNGNDQLQITVKDDMVHVGLNGTKYLSHKLINVVPNPYFGMLSISSFPEFSLHDFTIEYNFNDGLIDKFNDQSSLSWPDNINWFEQDGKLQSIKDSHYILNNDILSNNYIVSSDLTYPENYVAPLGLIVGSDELGNHYSVRLKTGIYGGISLYKHTTAYGGGVRVHYKAIAINKEVPLHLSTEIKNNLIILSLNDKVISSYQFETKLTSEKIGYINISGSGNTVSADNFTYIFNQQLQN